MTITVEMIQQAILGDLSIISELKSELNMMFNSPSKPKLQQIFETIEAQFMMAVEKYDTIHPHFIMFFLHIYMGYSFDCAERLHPNTRAELVKRIATLNVNFIKQDEQTRKIKEQSRQILALNSEIHNLESSNDKLQKDLLEIQEVLQNSLVREHKIGDSLSEMINVTREKSIRLLEKSATIMAKDAVIRAKESVIQDKEAVIKDKEALIQGKDSVIKDLQIKSLSFYQKGTQKTILLEKANKNIQTLQQDPLNLKFVEQMKLINKEILQPEEKVKKIIEANLKDSDKKAEVTNPVSEVSVVKPQSGMFSSLFNTVTSIGGYVVSSSSSSTKPVVSTQTGEQPPVVFAYERRIQSETQKRIQDLKDQMAAQEKQAKEQDAKDVKKVGGVKARLHLAIQDVVEKSLLKPAYSFINPLRDLYTLKLKSSLLNPSENKEALQKELVEWHSSNKKLRTPKK